MHIVILLLNNWGIHKVPIDKFIYVLKLKLLGGIMPQITLFLITLSYFLRNHATIRTSAYTGLYNNNNNDLFRHSNKVALGSSSENTTMVVYLL